MRVRGEGKGRMKLSEPYHFLMLLHFHAFQPSFTIKHVLRRTTDDNSDLLKSHHDTLLIRYLLLLVLLILIIMIMITYAVLPCHEMIASFP